MAGIRVNKYNIGKDNIRKLTAKLPKHIRLAVEFGVEVGDEWVRNEWLNKNVTNLQIEKAIAAIHEEGCKAQCDVIIGIPEFIIEGIDNVTTFL